MRRTAALIAAVVATGLSFGAGPRAEAQPPIRIGASLAQTGAFAELGQSQLRGYQLCVKHMNDKGGVLGRKLELVPYDDGSDRATAIRLYEKLIARDKVDLVLGPYASPITDAVAKPDRETQDADGGIRRRRLHLQEGAEVRLRYASPCGGRPGRAFSTWPPRRGSRRRP